MNEKQIRRIFLSDSEWQRTTSSWKQLKPKRNFNSFDPSDESVDDCTTRLQSLGYQIPFQVVEQWLYPHYYNRNTVNNYGWLDYTCVEFVEAKLSLEELVNVYVIRAYRPYVDMRSEARVFSGFMCRSIDLENWQKYSTWRIPPIVLDTSNLMASPKHAEIAPGLQLIEGHTRLGYLLALRNADHPLQDNHRVFILRTKSPAA